jgi:transposase
MGRKSRFSSEVRERAVRLVAEQRSQHASEWETIRSVAEKIGCVPETLRAWIRRTQVDAGERAGMTTSERDEFKRLQREVKELRQANEILRKASAFFAQAEIDRRPKSW